MVSNLIFINYIVSFKNFAQFEKSSQTARCLFGTFTTTPAHAVVGLLSKDTFIFKPPSLVLSFVAASFLRWVCPDDDVCPLHT